MAKKISLCRYCKNGSWTKDWKFICLKDNKPDHNDKDNENDGIAEYVKEDCKEYKSK